MKLTFTSLSLVAAVATGVFAAAPARAELIYGLTQGGALFSFDSATPGTVSAPVAIGGVTAGQTLIGMDFRPATGELYAMSYNATSGAAQLYTVNLTTAVASLAGSGFTLATGITRVGFDFNPSVDRIRVIANTDQNYRLFPTGGIAGNDTSVAYAAGDINNGVNPNVAGLAYSNNVAGASPTTLYGYDFATDSLVSVGNVNGTPNSPNGGQLFTIGLSGFNAGTALLDMDIGTSGVLYLAADSTSPASDLYTINTTNGAATKVGAIGGLQVLDIAVRVVPEPGTVALVGLAGSALLFARRHRRQ